jgi:hypothetical protein
MNFFSDLCQVPSCKLHGSSFSKREISSFFLWVVYPFRDPDLDQLTQLITDQPSNRLEKIDGAKELK